MSVFFKDAYEAAVAAGKAAAEAKVPVPMYVVQRADPLNDSSPVVKAYEPVMGGVCGFAWVEVRPGNSAVANWLKKNKLARPGYPSGVSISVMGYGQSMEKKEAYAYAFADAFEAALKPLGFKGSVYASSRMD